MGEGANHPLSLGPTERSSKVVFSGTRSLPVLTWERSLRTEGVRDLNVCPISARFDHEEISVPSDALTGLHLVSVCLEGGEVPMCVTTREISVRWIGESSLPSSLSLWPRQIHSP